MATQLKVQPVYVFLCSAKTRAEVFRKKLVGTSNDDWLRDFGDVDIGSLILVFDYDAQELIGPFRVVAVGKPVERGVWGGSFPAQARFELIGTNQKSVSAERVDATVPAFRRQGPTQQPRACFTGDEARRLLDLFDVPVKALPPPEPTAVPLVCAPTAAPAPPPEPRLYRTPQGFMVQSKAERAIADFFARNGIECHYERPIPPDARFKCDFYLPRDDVYVEYWGKPDEPEYHRRMEEKKAAYRMAGLRLVEVYPEDERELESRLWRDLRKYGVKATESGPARPSFLEWLRGLVRRLFGR